MSKDLKLISELYVNEVLEEGLLDTIKGVFSKKKPEIQSEKESYTEILMNLTTNNHRVMQRIILSTLLDGYSGGKIKVNEKRGSINIFKPEGTPAYLADVGKGFAPILRVYHGGWVSLFDTGGKYYNVYRNIIPLVVKSLQGEGIHLNPNSILKAKSEIEKNQSEIDDWLEVNRSRGTIDDKMAEIIELARTRPREVAYQASLQR